MRLHVKSVSDPDFGSETLGSEKSNYLIGPYLTETLTQLSEKLPPEQDVFVGWGGLHHLHFQQNAIVIHRGDEWRLPGRLPRASVTGFAEYGVSQGRTAFRSCSAQLVLRKWCRI